MQLRSARLCLDCEEIHEAQECPVCLSEAFVYITRWVPVEERRTHTRRPPIATNVAPVKSGVNRWVQRGMVGLAVMAASRWLLQPKDGDGAPPARPGGSKESGAR